MENLLNDNIIINSQNIRSEEAFPTLKCGDLILAKRYNTELEKEKILEGHREGPFLIIDKKGDNLICLRGTSVQPEQEFIHGYFALSNSDYTLNKITYFNIFNLYVINKETFIKKLDELSIFDQNKLIKKIKLTTKNYKLTNNKLEVNLKVQSGDVIDYLNSKYIVINIVENTLFCVSLKTYFNDFSYDDIKNIDFSKPIFISEDENFKYVNSIESSTFSQLLKKYREYIYCSNDKKIVQIGSIIFKDNKYYYIFGENENSWLTFEISEESDYFKDGINMCNTTYYTNYDEFIINKKDSFKLFDIVSKNDIENIKKRKKLYKKDLKSSNKNYTIGSIIESNQYGNERFIIIGIYDKIFECLSIDKLIKGIYSDVFIRRFDTILSENKSINGIKWLEQRKKISLSNISKGNIISKILKKQMNQTKQNNSDNVSDLKIQVGSIIKNNDSMFYIFGEEKFKWLVFKLYDKKNKSNLDRIIINYTIFYSDYKIYEMDKQDEITLALSTTLEEFEYLKIKKELYDDTRNSKQKKDNILIPKKIRVGNIVYKNNSSYIVEQVMGNLAGCINLIEKGRKNRKIQYFNIDELLTSENYKSSQKIKKK